MTDKTLEVKKSKVLEAADKCGTAKTILTTLFPEVFAAPWPPDLSVRIQTGVTLDTADKTDYLISERGTGPYKDISVFPQPRYNWKLLREGEGCLTLIPTHPV